ncbi:uncharacterized protein LOC100707031 isoform X1 [Oreochromis niloticus]|uniref:uncharacterized protein LOC100707031 isoform X1 n=1 Tax=Oreochromis niloticus TaxID=8128 RepID=UPI000393D754|nr:uncharacterized protein LOC100707031 isoform X1 [Oreochromis niloticus]XP_039478217.1 uncharacterized protein LOC120443487 isoform X1 [Oreochromis aureus]XP_039478218.1 uncharacterized protein LOC120443487 isoform X1 [Oreochromis aureus]
MLITMLTAMYMVVKVVETIGARFAREQEPLPYVVSQPLPWQVHSVSLSRRSSKADEYDGLRRNSIGVYRKKFLYMAISSTSLAIPCILSCSDSNASNGTCAVPAVPPLSPVEVEKAASTIQNHFRKFQQKKHKNGK